MQTNQTSLAKRVGINKLIVGFAAVLASAIIGVTGVAAAHANNNPNNGNHGNHGNHSNNGNHGHGNNGNHGNGNNGNHGGHGGGGYNGNVHVSSDLHLILNNSSNNVITVIFRPIINIFR